MPRYAILAGALALALTPAARAEDSDHIAAKATRATALVSLSKDGKRVPMGTGWLVDAKRKWVVTNFHVAPNVETAYLTFPKYKDDSPVTDPKKYDLALALPAKVIDSDPKNDLAILQLDMLPDGVTELPLAKAPARAGQALHSVGMPGVSAGYWTYNNGKARNRVGRAVTYSRGQHVNTLMLELQMSINGGDSGSAVLNNKGEVVGVVSGGYFPGGAHNVHWAIDLTVLKTFLGEAERLADGKATGEDLAELARREARKGAWARAVAGFTAAIKRLPKSGVLYRERADAQLALGRNDAVIADATRALELDPEDGLAANLRGVAKYQKGDNAAADADYTKALGLRPDDAVIHANRALALARLSKLDDAVTDLNDAVRLDPRYLPAYLERARIARLQKRPADAAADFRSALALAPNHPGFLVSLGECLAEDGKHAEAIECYDKGLKARHPAPSAVHRLAGVSLMALKQFRVAVQAFSEAIRLDPKNAGAWFGRASALEALGEIEKAQADYDEATRLDPALAKQLTTFSSRAVLVRNESGTDLKVTVSYEALTDKGEWKWYTATWTIKPGQATSLTHDGWKVQARSIRIWAESGDGRAWSVYKDTTLAICPGPYRAISQAVHVHLFGK